MDEQQSIMGLEIGSRIHDRYEIRDLLGQGGFAAVLRAHDTEIERDVAIKVLHIASLVSQGNDRDVMLTRFKREAKLAARITHPCVVQIFDYGVLEEQENPFIIMEILDGHDLEHEINQRGGLEPERVLPLFVDCLEALGDAHQRGIVHKDLKPSNLFLTDPGTRREMLKLVDFGIAHPGDSDRKRLTRTGFMLGTFEYMAPEYIEDQIISPAIDVYQMGLILIEMLTGRAAVQATNPWKCSMKHVRREWEVPEKLLQSPLGAVVDRATAREPDERFETAAEFADQLVDVDATEVPDLSGSVQWCKMTTPNIEVSTPDESTRAIIEDVEAARAGASATSEASAPSGQQAARPTGDSPIDNSPSMAAGVDDQQETTREIASDERSPRLLVAVFGVSVIAVAIAGLVAYQTWSDDGEVEASADEHQQQLAGDELAADDGDDRPEDGDEAGVDDDDPTGPHEDDEPSADDEPVELSIETIPPEATLAVDGELYEGETMRFAFEGEDADPIDFELDHDDYESETVTVGPDDGPVVTAELQEPLEVEEPSPTPEPEPQPEPEPEPEPRQAAEEPTPETTSGPDDEAPSEEEIADDADVDEDDGEPADEPDVEEGDDDDDWLMAP